MKPSPRALPFFIALLAITASTALRAATPAAIWFDDFSNMTSGAYTLMLNNNGTEGNTFFYGDGTTGFTSNGAKGITITPRSGGNSFPVLLNNSPTLTHLTVVMTVSNVTPPSDRGTLISLLGGGNNNYLGLELSGGLMAGFWQGNTYSTSASAFPTDGNVHTVALVVGQGAGATGYVDGVQAYYDSGLHSSSMSINGFAFGAQRGPANPIPGMKIHSIRIFNTRLTADEVARESAKIKQVYTRTLSAGSTGAWEDAAWSVAGADNQLFPTENPNGNYLETKLTLEGDAILSVSSDVLEGTISAACATGTDAATLTFVYPLPALPEQEEIATVSAPLPVAVSAGEGVTLAYAFAGATPEGYVAAPHNSKLYLAKKSTTESISIKIGPRTQTLGKIYPNMDRTGAYPVQGSFWNNTYASEGGTYSGSIKVADSRAKLTDMTFTFHGPTTWKNHDMPNVTTGRTTGNGELTSTYIDDGSIAAATQYTIGDVTLPAAPNARGWQIRLSDIPYEMYDLYFITASDVVASNLKECPVAISLDNGANWAYYAGDPNNAATIVGSNDSRWDGLPQFDGPLTEGKSYLKIRVSKTLFGDNISTIDITHGSRDLGSTPRVRSGLAGIQIVKVESDGVYTREASASTDWTASAWATGGNSAQPWRNADANNPVYARVDSAIAPELTVDSAVGMTSLQLTGTGSLTLGGSAILTAPAFDATGFSGNLILNAPVVGTIATGSDTVITLDAATDRTFANDVNGSGTIIKSGDAALTLQGNIGTALNQTAGALIFDVPEATTRTLSGTLTGTAGSIVEKRGAGKQVISTALAGFNAAETALHIKEGTLLFGSEGSAERSGVGTVAFKTITIDPGATFYLGARDAVATNVGNSITLKGTLTTSGFNNLPAITLIGGTIESRGGFNTTWRSFSYMSKRTISGETTSYLKTTNAGNRAFDHHLANGEIEVQAGSTLIVNAVLTNYAPDNPGDSTQNTIIKTGPGALIINTAPLYTGTTSILGGTYTLNAASAITGATTIGNGTEAALFNGTGSTAAPVTVKAKAAIASSLTLTSNLTLEAGSAIAFTPGTPLTVSGTLSASAPVAIQATADLTEKTYLVIEGAGAANAAVEGFTSPSAKYYVFSDDSGISLGKKQGTLIKIF